MSNSSGRDTLRLRQLRAIAQNLFTLANQHRDQHDSLVAEALYGRALSVAQQIEIANTEIANNDGCSLINQIRTEQMLLCKYGSPEKAA